MGILKSALPQGANSGDEVCFQYTEEAGRGPVATNVQVTRSVGTGMGMQGIPQGCRNVPAMGMGNPMEVNPPMGMGVLPEAGMGSYVGQIKLWFEDKGWGMIACDDTFRQYQKDIFFAKSVVTSLPICQRDLVQFSIKMELKGPAATQVQPIQQMPIQSMGVPRLGAPYGGGVTQFWGINPFGGGMALMGGKGDASAPAAFGSGMRTMMPRFGGMDVPFGMDVPGPFASKRAPSSQTFYGKVLTYNEKGWGHISCDATHAIYKKDVFVLRSSLNGQTIQPDDLVSFKVESAAKGPQAVQVSVMPRGVLGTNEMPGSLFCGCVARWNEEKGYGFIEGDGLKEIFGKDVFLSKRELQATPNNGDRVQFSVELGKNGMPRATNISFADFAGYGLARSGAGNGSVRIAPY